VNCPAYQKSPKIKNYLKGKKIYMLALAGKEKRENSDAAIRAK